MSQQQRESIGRLALEYCDMRLPLRVLQSPAGFYLGTACAEEGPVSRESVEYWATCEAAVRALGSGEWTQRDAP